MVVGEGDGVINVPVTLSAPGTNAVTVHFSTGGGSATGTCSGGTGSDYLTDASQCSSDGTLTFAPGQTTKTIRVEISNDLVPEGQESFLLTLTSPTVATLGRNTTTITIVDDDNLASATSTVTAAPNSVSADGATTATVTVTLTDTSADPVADKIVSLAQPGGRHSVISAPGGVSDGNGQVTFTVTDTTVESVTYTATDVTDGVVLTPTASVSFTTPPYVPGAPGTPAAVGGNAQATVSWSAPAPTAEPHHRLRRHLLPRRRHLHLDHRSPHLHRHRSHERHVLHVHRQSHQRRRPQRGFPASNSVTPAAGDSFHVLTPAWILDSRPGTGNTGGYSSPWGAGVTRNVSVGGVDGVPSNADDAVLRAWLRDFSRRRPRWGRRRAAKGLRRDGRKINNKRVQRLWREEGLKVPYRKRKKPHRGIGTAVGAMRPIAPNAAVGAGLPVRHHRRRSDPKLLNVIDEFTRECPAIVVDRSIDADKVVATLDRVALERGYPAFVRFDNGGEFIANVVADWCRFNGVATIFIDPGSPWQNAWIESFNGRLRDELLNGWHFDSLLEAQVLIEDWRVDYNMNRPHSAHGDLTPAEFAARHRRGDRNTGTLDPSPVPAGALSAT